jgi:serpin B
MVSRLIFASIATLWVMMTVLSCGGGASEATIGDLDPRISLASSALNRNASPDTSPTELSELVDGNTAFALDLYKNVKSQQGNIFYSPYSISIALGMTYAGARTETESQMAQTLHFTLSQDRLHPAFDALDLELAKRADPANSEHDQPLRLVVANSLWGQKDFAFLPQFLDTLALNYGAGLRLVDFQNAPEEGRDAINDWVADKTENKILELIPAGIINSMTRLVLTNAIYFKAAWLSPFKEESTVNGDFQLLDGTKVTVPMMHQIEECRYVPGDGWQACEIPYDGRQVSILIMLPDEGRFEEFENSLDAAKFKSITDGLSPFEVQVTLPKFRAESEFMLSEVLSEMGMPLAFDPRAADLSGMDGRPDLFIREVIHKAFVAVDEKGTEAAASTAVVVELKGMPMADHEFTVDRPFIFAIRDNITGAILFLGRVLNPSA